MTTVTMHGPMLDGRAPGIIAQSCDEMAKDVAELGNVMVRTNLNTVLRTQTPIYRTLIAAKKEASGQWKVWDGGRIVYGPWLEGVGSRNYPKTRFKGYFTFRRTTQQLQRMAVRHVQPIVRKLIEKLDG
jgi:hypothetical protein